MAFSSGFDLGDAGERGLHELAGGEGSGAEEVGEVDGGG